MKEDKLAELSMSFSVQMVNLVKNLKSKHESVISNQIGRSGTSIGANIYEANYAQGSKDFISKLENAPFSFCPLLFCLLHLLFSLIIGRLFQIKIREKRVKVPTARFHRAVGDLSVARRPRSVRDVVGAVPYETKNIKNGRLIVAPTFLILHS